MNYRVDAIEKLIKLIDGDTEAFNWLMENGYKELPVLLDAVGFMKRNDAFDYLLKNKYIVLAAFVNAVWGDTKAFNVLMKTKAHHWAAMANYINGDAQAGVWLNKTGKKHYADLAEKLRKKIRKETDENTSIFGSSPI